jgi:hypothetical protein
MTMRKLTLAALAFAGCLSGAPANADDDASSFVRLHAIDLLENALSPDQTTTLQLVAYQAAIADACTGFQLDDKKFVAAFEKLAPADAAKMSDAQKAYFDKHLLVIYGVLMGGELAAMAGDVSAACAQAAELQADPEMKDIIIWR